MRRTVSMMVLLIVGILIAANFATVVKPLNIDNSNPTKMQVDKKVWNGSEWVDEIVAQIGDTVKFRISIYQPPQDEDETYSLYDILVTDYLPDGMEYVENSSTFYGENVAINGTATEEPTVSGNTLTWDLFTNELTVLVGEGGCFYIEFEVNITGYGNLTNRVFVDAYHCSEENVQGEAIANVTVLQPAPEISLQKWVSLDGENWTKSLEEYLPHVVNGGNKIYFKINLSNVGDINVTGVLEDFLPSFLKYNYDSNIGPTYANDSYINWSGGLSKNSSLIITYSATPLSGGAGENVVKATTDQGVNASDNVTIILYEPSIDVNKRVRKFCPQGDWSENVKVSGGIVEFRVDITYHGNPLDPLNYVFHNITIVDVLPSVLTYIENSTSFEGDWSNWDEYYTGDIEPVISDHTLTWDLDDIFRMPDGGTLTLYFKAMVIDDADCGIFENVVTVTGDECSGTHLEESDNATIEIPCPDVQIEKKIKDPGTGEWKDSAYVFYGDEMTFNITVDNVGERDVSDITVRDPLIENLQFISGTPGPTINENELVWDNISLKAGEKFYIEFTVRFTGVNCYGCYNNTAYLVYYVGCQEIERNDSTRFCIRNDGYPPRSHVDEIDPYWHNSAFTITATANDDETHIARVELYYSHTTDGENWSEWQLFGSDTDGSDGWSWEFFGADGDYKFCSIAYDAVGNKEDKTYAEEASAVIDTVPPESSVDPIVPYERYEGTPIDLSYTASDDRSGVAEVRLYYRYSADNVTWTDWNEGGWSFVISNSGYYEFYSVAVDNAGNVEAAPEQADARCKIHSLEELKVNITKPEVGAIYFKDRKIMSIPFNLTIIIGPITISADVENAHGDTSVEFIICNESKAIVDEEPFNYTWDERAFLGHHIEVIAYDDIDGLPIRTANASIDVFIFNLALKRNQTEEETGVVKGKVYDNGTLLKKGIGGVKITVVETNETYTARRILFEGRYSIKLAPGTYHLKFEKEGYVTKIVEVTVNASEVTEKDVGLDRTGTLFGRVLEKSKLLFRGIRGATVEAVNNDTGEHFSVNTSFRGKYSMELPPGNYTVTASANGYTCVTEYNVIIKPGKSKKLNFKLEKEESS